MKKCNLFMLLIVAGLVFAGCDDKNEVTTLAPAKHDHQIIDWETTNPEIIEAINSEIENNERVGRKAAIQVYRNFRIEADSNTPADILALIKGEIDQMYVSGLKASTLAKMDDVTSIHISPTVSRGMYYSGGRVVINDYATYRSVKRSTAQVVLHELTHFYHDRYISGGFNNSTVNSLYTSARSRRIYPSSAYVLSNRVEYLGTSSEAYFNGTSRDPYNRSTVQSKDPNLASFLNANF